MGDKGPSTQQRSSKYRTLSGPAKFVENLIFSAIVIVGTLWILEVYFYLGLTPMVKQYIGFFLACSLGGVFITIPDRKGRSSQHVPWYDWILFSLALVVGLYIAVFYPSIQYMLTLETPTRVVLGAITILLVLEALRRIIGWFMVAITALFILYAPLADFFPGMLEGKAVPLDQLINYLYLDSNAILGIPISVGSTIILAFVLFGHGLSVTGATKFFMDLSSALMGRFRGGPAKMAVTASSLFGTISGAAVANVVTTGVITIPMMKKAGFRPRVAGAIEAAASTGGQLMPPVMGAAAFLIAELLAIPYREVVVAALVPAILYYFTLFVQIDLESAKFGLKGIPKNQLPSIVSVFKSEWVSVIPLVALIVALFVLNYRPAKAGLMAVFTLLGLSLLKKKDRLTFGKLHQMVVSTGRGLLEITAICSAAGIVIGVLNVSGLGFGLSLQLVKTVGQNLFLLLLLSAIVCIILGMGMPTVAVYILLAVLVAPALTELGIVPLAAHLFIFYFGMMCMITPPVCLASYAAATIAETNPIKLGWTSMRLAIIALMVPFLFVLEPSLILQGEPAKFLLAIPTALCGGFFLGAGLTGYLFHPLSIGGRLLSIIGGFGLLVPVGIGFNIGWISDILGILIVVPLFLWSFSKRKDPARS
ncbi:MAG: TRAP transporter permease [Deltaproteobacteria bacterium]|jgi:TRAP transporter 4TM/12TM fusion protein|nr:TRAP transporter permease [Deltaproteobacteria bacterium]